MISEILSGGIVIALLFFIYNFFKEQMRFARLINKFPGPEIENTFVGNSKTFTTDTAKIFSELRKADKKYPKTFRLWSFWHALVSLSDVDYVETILSNARYIDKSRAYVPIQAWLKTGLLTSTGKKWFERRKLLTPAFHFNILKRLTRNFDEHNESLLELLKEESQKEHTDVVPIISTVALKMICGTSMGVSLNLDDQVNDDYRQAIYSFSNLIYHRIVKSWLLIDLFFMFHPLYKLQKKLVHTLHSFTTNIIKKREENFDANEFENSDEIYMKKKLAMLDLLLLAKKRDGKIDDEGIREEVDTFTFEGHDTVSMALCYALMLIANHEEHQKKIIDELDGIFGDSNRTINFEDLQNMNYMELCLKESLRLYPSVPYVSRTLDEDIVLDEQYTIPRGTVINIAIVDIHRKEKYFPNPDKFDPDRFLPENSRSRHPYAYIPFSAGPRNCIGQKYAMLEMKSIVATILRNYELQPVDTPESIILSLEMVLRSKNGVRIKFVPRVK